MTIRWSANFVFLYILKALKFDAIAGINAFHAATNFRDGYCILRDSEMKENRGKKWCPEWFYTSIIIRISYPRQRSYGNWLYKEVGFFFPRFKVFFFFLLQYSVHKEYSVRKPNAFSLWGIGYWICYVQGRWA